MTCITKCKIRVTKVFHRLFFWRRRPGGQARPSLALPPVAASMGAPFVQDDDDAQLPSHDVVCPRFAGRCTDPRAGRSLLPAAGCPAAAGRSGAGPFQRTADQHFNGDLQALVAHYGASQDPVFTQDATSLQQLVNQQQHLQGRSPCGRVPGTSSSPTCCCAPIRPLAGYPAQLRLCGPLKQAAIFCGVAAGLLASPGGDLLLGLLLLPFRSRQRVPVTACADPSLPTGVPALVGGYSKGSR